MSGRGNRRCMRMGGMSAEENSFLFPSEFLSGNVQTR
jgi:hypothetical protein